MLHPLHKIGIGCVVLALTALAWWYSADGSTWDAPPAIHVDDVSWAALPLVMEDETVKSPAAISSAGNTGSPRADQMVFFVYRPHDCYTNREAMDRWHELAASHAQVQAINVLKERGATPARRYLSEFATPYPTRLDTTEWFNHTLGVDRTPAVVLVSEDETPRVVSPSEQRSDNDRRRLLDVS
ncbi:hypothetical protein [Longimonas halophila]|nr:hypothetical protein [Longimonas halophila]